MFNIICIAIIIVICLYFIIKMIDDEILKRNEELVNLYTIQYNTINTLKKIIKEIQRELKFTQLNECPKEELKQIPKEIIEWIDLLELEKENNAYKNKK